MNDIYSLNEKERDEIEQALRDLLLKCQIYQIPMFASVAVANTEEGTEYNNIMFGGESHNIHLTDDKIQNHVLVANGFRAVPPREVVDFDINEVM